MARFQRYVYQCPACECLTREVALMRVGGKVREPCWDRDGRSTPGVKVIKVLCWWCREYHAPEEVDACMALPEKRATAESSTSSTSSALDAGLLSQYTELWVFLTSPSYPDGRKRLTGRLLLTCESGLLGLSLQDDQTGQYAFLNGRSVNSLLEEVELRLSDGSLAWKPSRYKSSRKPL